jgi:hypothetical protein
MKYAGMDYAATKIRGCDIIYQTAIPRFLELFNENKIKATFFLVGWDANLKSNRLLIERIVDDGHEIENHTMTHPFGFRKLSGEKKENEIKSCEKVVEELTGRTPIGFRAPGYDIDEETIKILEDRGYKYDSSILPTFVYPFLMFVDSVVHSRPLHDHGPKLMWGLAPLKPYQPSRSSVWRKSSKGEKRRIVEIPITSMPIVRLPFHGTFVLTFGNWLFRTGLWLTRESGLPLNYIFHLVDLSDRISGVTSSSSVRQTMEGYDAILKAISKVYRIVKTSQLVKFKR